MTNPTVGSPLPRWRKILRQLAPWVISAVVVAAILQEYELDDIARELGQTDLWALVPLAAGVVLVTLALITAADTQIFVGCVGRPSYADVLRGKAACSMLDLLGYAFGRGGYGVWIARVTGAGAALSVGMILFLMASDLAAVSSIASLSIHLGGVEIEGGMPVVAPVIAGLMVGLMLFGQLRLLGRERVPKVFHPWSMMPLQRSLGGIALRMLNIGSGVVFTWAAARSFGLTIPVWVMAAYLPVIMVIGSLPINVLGFGPVQAAWLMFTPWADGPRILAFQLVWHVLLGVAIFLRGLPFVRRVVREIDEGRTMQAATPEAG